MKHLSSTSTPSASTCRAHQAYCPSTPSFVQLRYSVPFQVKGNWHGEAAVLQNSDMISSSVKSSGVSEIN